jgi:hypothetical protein
VAAQALVLQPVRMAVAVARRAPMPVR